MNRLQFANKHKTVHTETKLKRKAKEYFSMSCPKCGLPREFDGRTNQNRFGNPPSKNAKCIVCNSLLHEE